MSDARMILMADNSVDCVITSPPYWGQRCYGVENEIGLEPTYTEYIDNLAACAKEIKRVLRPKGALWLNLGDTYNTRTIIRPSAHQAGFGHDNENIRMTWAEARDVGLVRYSARQPGMKDKDLMLLPMRVASRLVEDGWFLRCDVVWSKPFGSPENANDRPTRMHEYLFLFNPTSRSNYRKDRVPEARTSVWEIAPTGQPGHPAAFPDELVRRCVLLTTDPGDVVYDPFGGSGTTARVATAMGRVGISTDASDNLITGGKA